MKDSFRRILLFFGIVLIGLLLIFIDLPILYLILVVFLFGVILLFITGSLSLKNLRREKENIPHEEKPAGPTFGERFAEKAPTLYTLYKKLTGGNRKPKEKKKKEKGSGFFSRKEKGSGLFSIKEKEPAKASTPAIAAPAAETPDDELDEEDLFGDINLDELDDEGLDDFGGDEAVLDMGQDDAGYMADDVASILAQAGDLDDDSLEGGFDQPLDTPLDDSFDGSFDQEILTGSDDLDSIDLDEIEMDEEPELPDELVDLDEIPDPFVDTPIEEGEGWDKNKKDEFGFGAGAEAISSNVGFLDAKETEKKSSFFSKSGGGAGSEGDLLSELKSSAKNVRKKQDVSLVRELKDAEVSPEELEEELSNLLTILGGKRDG